MRDYLLYLTDEVEEEFALRANQARQQLWDPGQPLDGWDTNTILVHCICQGVLIIIKTQQPKNLEENSKRISQCLNLRPINHHDAQKQRYFINMAVESL